MAIPISRGGIDYPDFHASLMLSDSASDVGLSELAVRLSSGISYSRAGNIIFMENFDHGYGNWSNVGSDAICTPQLVTRPTVNGHYAVSLHHSIGTTWVSYIGAYIPIPSSDAFGITFSFNNLGTIQEFSLRYYLVTQAKAVDVIIKMSTNDNIYWLKDFNGTFRNIGNYYLSTTDLSIYSRCKVLIIPSLGILRYVSINETIFNTNEIMLPVGSGSTRGFLYLRYKLVGGAADLEQMFIDNIYVSANE